MADTKYPQSPERNEYRYIDFAWMDEIAEGLTAGAEKHPGETWLGQWSVRRIRITILRKLMHSGRRTRSCGQK